MTRNQQEKGDEGDRGDPLSLFHVDTWTLDNIVVALTVPSRGLSDTVRELGLGVRDLL